jgi:E1-E2 ATPase
MLTRDKKNIIARTFVVWRVGDALAFTQAIGNQGGAEGKLDGLLTNAAIGTLGGHDLSAWSPLLRATCKWTRSKVSFLHPRILGTTAVPENEGIPVSLDAAERRRISTRLGAGLAGISLLGLGTVLVRLAPDQWQIGELCRGLAAAIVGIPTLISGIRGVATGDTRPATDQLVAIAILAAAATGDFVTATLIPSFLERSSLGARAAIEGIRALGARQAVRWRNGAEEKVDPNDLRVGDEILVRPGERIAVDGTVLEGRAAVDQSAITGESLHEDVAPAVRCLREPSRWTDC